MKTHGGKRENSGRKAGVSSKINRTYSIDRELLKFRITSKMVNELLRNEYMPSNTDNNHSSQSSTTSGVNA